jgi:hypothetical protein
VKLFFNHNLVGDLSSDLPNLPNSLVLFPRMMGVHLVVNESDQSIGVASIFLPLLRVTRFKHAISLEVTNWQRLLFILLLMKTPPFVRHVRFSEDEARTYMLENEPFLNGEM